MAIKIFAKKEYAHIAQIIWLPLKKVYQFSYTSTKFNQLHDFFTFTSTPIPYFPFIIALTIILSNKKTKMVMPMDSSQRLLDLKGKMILSITRINKIVYRINEMQKFRSSRKEQVPKWQYHIREYLKQSCEKCNNCVPKRKSVQIIKITGHPRTTCIFFIENIDKFSEIHNKNHSNQWKSIVD